MRIFGRAATARPPVPSQIRETDWCFRVFTPPPPALSPSLGLTIALPVLAQEPPSPPATAPETQPAPAAAPPRRSGEPGRPGAVSRAGGEPAPPCAVADRRAEVPGRLQAFRLGQPRRAQGRHAARLCRRLVRQPQPLLGEGRSGRRPRPCLRLADGRQPRRAVVRVLPHLRVGLLSGRLLVGDLRAQSQGTLPGRLADHARGRDLLASRRRRRRTRARPSTTRTSSRRRRPATTR